MTREKPFAEVSRDGDLFIGGACLYAGIVKQNAVGIINAAVAARERDAAAKALREAAEEELGLADRWRDLMTGYVERAFYEGIVEARNQIQQCEASAHRLRARADSIEKGEA